jgi:germination protein M
MKKDCTSPTQGSHDILTFRADRPPMFRLPQIRLLLNRRLKIFLPQICLPLICLLVLCFLCGSLCGCAASAPDEDSVRVFYLNADKTGLVSRQRVLQAESVYGQAEELLDALTSAPADEGVTAPISGFERRDFSIEKNTVSIDFTVDYRKMDNITEKLTRAAIVNTMCELEEIRRVTIRINGALIVDENGSKSENMTADQFIYNAGSEMLNFERAEIHLYFATADGKQLVETYRTVVFNGNIPMERVVVEQIIAGPNGDFNYPTVNKDTRLVNVLTRDNICTVTLDSTFLTNPNPVDPEVAVYSIVNSLTELPAISQVQIIIEGEDNPVFMEKFTLDSENLLKKNTKIVQSGG